jgi:flagellar biosynthetic protein FliR
MLTIDYTNWLLVFVRVSALLAVFPLFTAPNFPMRLRAGLGALVAFLVAPTLPSVSVGHLTFGTLISWLLAEVTVGVLMGFVSRMLFFIVDAAGNLVTSEMGLNLASQLNPFSSSQTQAPGMILYYLAAMIFLSLDMHHALLIGFQRSYTFLPVGGAQLREALFQDIVSRTGNIFLVALQMAAPMVAISFLITLIFSVLSRAVPQMNVFAENFAVRALAGLVVFGLTLNLMAQHVLNYARRLPEDVLRIAQLLGSG